MIKHIILAFSILLFSLPCFSQEEKIKIKSIEINGNYRLDYETIYSYIDIKINSEVSNSDLDRIIKNLYKTQLFSKVDAYINKKNYLVINVQENPIINRILISGNRSFSDKELSENILKLKPLNVFTRAKLQNDIINLIAFHRNSGKLGIAVEYTIKNLPNNQIDLVFKITEGPSTKIKTIKFIGNHTFSEKTLKKVMISKEHKFFKLFSNNTKYTTEKLTIDQALIGQLYTTNGFLNFKIRSVIPEVSDNYRNANIVFSIEEGPQYKFGNANVTVDKDIKDQNIVNHIKKIVETHHSQDNFFSIDKVNSYTDQITKYLNSNEIFFTDIKTHYHIRNHNVDVDYIIGMGNKIYINNINFYGNSRTIDKVIRQQLITSEGDIYNFSALQKSKRNILSLGFFDIVNFESQKVENNLVNVNFNVKEKSTGAFQIGAGWSSTSGLIGHTNIRERNLFGTGKEVSLSLERSQLVLSGSLDFTEHKVFDTDISLGAGIFYSSQDQQKNSTFSSSNTGFILKSSYNITNDLIHSLRYSYKYSDIYNVKDSASSFIKEQEGKNTDSSIGYTLAYNKLNNYFRPSNGFLFHLSQDLSGIGGTLHYIKTEGYFAYFKTILNKISDDIILKIKPAVGYIFGYNGEEVKIGQRFFIGNNEIRGFNLSGIGPRDEKTKDALGGKLYFTTVAQVDFPIGLPKDVGVKGSLFIDSGTLFGLDYKDRKYYDSHLMRISAGFGFSWSSPLGPMRLDFGFPLIQEEYDVTNIIKFSIDTGI